MTRIPKFILIVIMAIVLLLSAYQHGKPKTGKENFWVHLIGMSIQVGLLLWAGFFNGLFGE
jgi:hypothetical protein